MKTQTEVVVIGGGIAGCSAVYHLTMEGITDVMLLERDELTSGTTWHSAAQVTNFGGNQTMVGLKTHSINLYKELAEDPEYPINYHHATGGIRVATKQDHLDGYNHFLSMAKGMGVDFELLDAEECARRHPIIRKDGMLGGLWDPLDGDIDPAQLCQALARRARKNGAEIHRFTPVTGLTQRADDSWIVHTDKGDISCAKIVNAGGYRCNEIGAMMGVTHPVASMEHQYMLTDNLPEIEALEETHGADFRVPLIRCPEADFYQRAEKKGLLIGFYEQDCKTWGLDGIDPNFTNALCPDDLDRVTDVMAGAFHRLPCLETAGIKSVVNGPITYTPDGLPLVGKIPGKRNAYCITGLRAGLGEGGGHGWLLAQIIAHGEACYDTWSLDPRRFSRHVDDYQTSLKAIEDYQNEFRFHMPHEHRPAGRNLRVTPLTKKLESLGAELGVVNNWERARYFKPSDDFHETHSFRFNETHDVVANEIKSLRKNLGLMEVSGFNRYRITGADALDFLEGIMCTKVPRIEGRVRLCYFLNHQGNVKGEATLANMGDEIWYGSAAAAESHDMDWLVEHLDEDLDVKITPLTETHQILVIAGHHAPAALEALTGESLPNLRAKEMSAGDARLHVMAVSFSGEPAYELHIKDEDLEAIFDQLMDLGKAFNIGLFGLEATESMRIEMGYRHWKADLITEFNPFESDLGRFVHMDKDFIGKESLQTMMVDGDRQKFVSLEITSDTFAAHPGDSMMQEGKVIGTITSAAYGHRVGKNMAMGFVSPEYSEVGSKFEVLILGEMVKAEVIEPKQHHG